MGRIYRENRRIIWGRGLGFRGYETPNNGELHENKVGTGVVWGLISLGLLARPG